MFKKSISAESVVEMMWGFLKNMPEDSDQAQLQLAEKMLSHDENANLWVNRYFPSFFAAKKHSDPALQQLLFRREMLDSIPAVARERALRMLPFLNDQECERFFEWLDPIDTQLLINRMQSGLMAFAYQLFLHLNCGFSPKIGEPVRALSLRAIELEVIRLGFEAAAWKGVQLQDPPLFEVKEQIFNQLVEEAMLVPEKYPGEDLKQLSENISNAQERFRAAFSSKP